MGISRAENKGASNVNDVPLLAVDVPNQNLERHDDVSTFSKILTLLPSQRRDIVIYELLRDFRSRTLERDRKNNKTKILTLQNFG